MSFTSTRALKATVFILYLIEKARSWSAYFPAHAHMAATAIFVIAIALFLRASFQRFI